MSTATEADSIMTNTPDPANPAIQAARNRLDRLEGFLREDPGNTTLLTDAFETALRCGEFARAEFHLRHGLALNEDPWAWRLKEGDFWLAQNQHAQAQAVLQAIADDPAAPPAMATVLAHNLAYVDLHSGLPLASVARLAPLMEATGAAPQPMDEVLAQSLQAVWLRALHRTGELERAMHWALQADAAGQLSPRASGVASLIALDADDAAAAGRWSQRALAQAGEGERPLEALNVQASLMLGEGDPARARQLAGAALQLQPEDGRSWSVLAFADMLAGQLDVADAHFARALAAMPEHVGTWHGLGWVQILQRRWDEAQATFEHALEMDRNFAESHGGMAVVLALKGERVQAQEYVERALRLDKNCMSGQYAQAILNGEAQDPVRFQRLAKRLMGRRYPG